MNLYCTNCRFLQKSKFRLIRRVLKVINKLCFNKKSTAGSSGESFIVFKDRRSMAMELAAAWGGYSLNDLSIGDRQGRFWKIPLIHKDQFIAKLIDFECNRRRCSVSGFDKQVLEG
ncbi:MAG: hypothetical protein GY874_13065 [Desulfobacteraceae bacterium]|nr:hypothetical protein [Desulfobacteraceae bacterium]